MIWKNIGNSVIGSSHVASGKPCEDAIEYGITIDPNGDEVMICCVSDGAGSAQYGGWAAGYAVHFIVQGLSFMANYGMPITEGHIYSMAENLYDNLLTQSQSYKAELNEFSCTLLGCYITGKLAVFFHIGDGAIVRNDGTGFYTPVWWPDNGEYQNTTSFIIDDRGMGNLNVLIIEDTITEVAILSDGLQLLALNTEDQSAHQPFFSDMFRHLRKANDADQVNSLNTKLAEYLDSPQINSRTDDDKTLFLATRITS